MKLKAIVSKRLQNVYGLTLIEIIISIAILGIISLAFLSLFSSGYIWIANAGHKSKDLFESQQEIENKISTGTNTTSSALTFQFKKQDGTTTETVTVGGEVYTEVPGQEVEMKVFVPANSVLSVEP